MAAIDIRHPHGTDKEDAAERTRKLLEDFAAKRDDLVGRVTWSKDGTHADVTGKGFNGSFDVTDREVTVQLELKMIARPFKGKIEGSLQKRLDEEFGAAGS